jgi:alpha-beta hydrolase superfamily lysophospholipase
VLLCVVSAISSARAEDKVVDIPTRNGVSQRFLLISTAEPKAAVILFAGGHGGLQLNETGSPRWGNNNCLVRSARLFAAQGFSVAVVDAPSDKQSPPYLSGFRQSPEHAADVKAVIAWLKDEVKAPVWLIGTSRGTQSVAAVSTALGRSDGPDGVVLTSTILNDPRSRPVPDMALEKLTIPVLVVHHEQQSGRKVLPL